MTNAWPWGQIITTVLGSGVVAALANNGIAWLRSRQERAAATRMTARRAAEELERYSRECAIVAQSWQSAEPYGVGPGAQPWPELPTIQDLDWSAFPANLSDRAIAFRGETTASINAVGALFEYDDDMAIDLGLDVSLEAGLTAWALAKDLRRYAQFPARSSKVNAYYDYVEWMGEKRAARDEADRQRMETHKRKALETRAKSPSI